MDDTGGGGDVEAAGGPDGNPADVGASLTPGRYDSLDEIAGREPEVLFGAGVPQSRESVPVGCGPAVRAASGYPREPRTTTVSLASATAAQPPAESPDLTVIPIQRACTRWDPAQPFDASLVFEVDGSEAALDLNLPVMTGLLGDLESLNRKRAIQAGWTTDDYPEEGEHDEKPSLTGRLLASHTAVQAGLNRLPLSWQAILAGAVIAIIVLFAAIFG